MGGQLQRSVLMAGWGDRVVLAGDRSRVDIELDAPVPALDVGPTFPLLVSELAEFLGCGDTEDLRAALDGAGFLEPRGGSTRRTEGQACAGGGVVPLARALSACRVGRPVAGLIVTTATEALWTGHDESLALLAVTMFAARLPLDPRGQLYRAIRETGNLWFAGDRPSGEDVEWLAGRAYPSHPEVYDLLDRAPSGSIRQAASVMHARAGRLAVGGSLECIDIGSADSRVSLTTALAGDLGVSGDPVPGASPSPTWVVGIDQDEAVAEAKCMSEAAEYLLSTQSISDRMLRSSAEDLVGQWVSPDGVICYSVVHRDRLGVGPFDPSEVQGWALGRRAGRPIWVPEGLLAAPEIPPSWWHPSGLSSSGVAAHGAFAHAIMNAWLELVERDAFQRARARGAMADLSIVDPVSLDADVRALLTTLAKRSAVCILVLPSPTGIPVVLVRADMDHRVVIGMAAAHRPHVAVRRALMEALAQGGDREPVPMDVRLVRTPADHGDLYSDPVWREKLEWIAGTGGVVALDEIPAHGFVRIPPRVTIYRYPDLGLPTRVVRAIDPLLIPITFGYDSEPDGRADLAGLRERSGRAPDQPWDPHPLA